MTEEKTSKFNKPKTMPAAQVPDWDETLQEDLEKEMAPVQEEATKPVEPHHTRAYTGKPSRGYDELLRILTAAYRQSADGKGKDRHANSPVGFRPWDEQPIIQIGRMVGPGFASGQVQKKVQEAVTMAGNRNFTAAKNEALGAIVYAAALFKLLDEMERAMHTGGE